MKRISAFVTALLLILVSCMTVSAQESSASIIEIEDTTVIFQENSEFSAEEKQLIAEYIVNGNNGVSTYGIRCTLFGHKYTEESVITITHCVYPTAPRCLKEFFMIKTCSRCDNTEVERIGYTYIDCCP